MTPFLNALKSKQQREWGAVSEAHVLGRLASWGAAFDGFNPTGLLSG